MDQIKVEKTSVENAKLKDLRKEIVAFIFSKPELSAHTDRIQGLLGTLFQKIAIDHLYYLAEKKCIDKKLIRAWDKLRQKYVHPNDSDLRDVSNDGNQKLFNLISLNTVLIY